MLQADNNHTLKVLSRRSAIALVGVSAIAASAAALQAADPIFAVLDEHRGATARLSAAIHASGNAESAIPQSQRSWGYSAWDTTPPENCADDPKWIETQLELRDANDNWDDAVYDLLTTMPTTVAGLAALLSRLGRNEWALEETADDSGDEGVYIGACQSSDDDISDAARTFFERLADHLKSVPLTVPDPTDGRYPTV